MKINRIINRRRTPLLLALAAVTAGAQGELRAAQLEEVVVTAQKREQSLQGTPVAVSAFTAATIENQRIQDLSNLAEFTPNMTFDTTAPVSGLSSGAVVFIRGIGQTDFSLTTDPGVGTYIDGVYSSRSVGGVMDVLDVERIEVLRGPQGTLFGRNTIGGAISITSRRPGEEFAGDVSVTAGSDDRLDFRGAVDLPITDALRTNFALSYKSQDGYVDRELVGDELGDEDKVSLRFAADYDVSDTLNAYFTYDYTRIDEQSAASVLAGITSGVGTSTYSYNEVFVPANNPPEGLFDDRFLGDDDDKSYATGPTGTELDIWGTALTLSWSTEYMEIKSTTAWRSTEGEFFRDPDNSPIAITHTSNPDYEHEQFSQEFQFTGAAFEERLQYVAGLYFFEEEGTDNVFVPIYGEVPTPGSGFAIPLYINNFADVENSSEAAYLQGTYSVTDALGITLGVRYTRDDKEFDYLQFVSTDPEGQMPAVSLVGDGPGSAEDDFSKTTYKAGLEYSFGDDNLLYLSYSEGFKSGGFNIRYVVPRPEPLPFDPEEVDAWEIGLKWQGLDNRVRANLAAFFTDYTDVQVTLFETGGGPLTQNAGEAEVQGIELELTALIGERLTLGLAAGYTDAEYTEINLPTTDITQPIGTDTELPNTPEFTYSINAEYGFDLGGGELVLRANYFYSDDVQNDAQNSVFLFQDSYYLLNASVTYTGASQNWDLVVYADNLTDERFITSGDSNFGLGFHEANYNPPREYGVTARYRF